MYSVKLDENNYYTGSYAVVGQITGGVDIPTLPPIQNAAQASCYKWGIVVETIIVEVPKINPENGEQEVDENGNFIFVQETKEERRMDWSLDEGKYALIMQDLLSEKIQGKVKEIGQICKNTIYAGVDIVLSDGDTYHFSMNADDQTNIESLFSQAVAGMVTQCPYHADGRFCQMFSVDDMIKVGKAAMNWKIYHTTLCNHINMYIRSLTSEEAIDAVTYSVDILPQEYLDRFNNFMVALTTTA
jgi:hypothetical protein